MFKIVLVAASLSASVAFAADKPLYAPPSDWVKPAAIPDAPPDARGEAVQVLLSSQQAHYGLEGADVFSEVAIKILKPEGLAFVNALTPTWDPATQTLTLHRFSIIRAGKAVDLLGGGAKVTVLRRETNLEAAALDGRLTASMQPEGLQVGDIVDFAMTLRRQDPVLQGRLEGFVALPSAVRSGRFYVRQIWSAPTALQWKATEGMPTPVVTRRGGDTEILIDAPDAEAPKPPAGAPLRFATLGQLQLTSYAGWSDVSALMAPLYAKAAQLGADSPLRAEARKIAAASDDPKVRAAAALRLVQDQVRYVFLGLDLGGYVPAAADLTWSRRFGDCKGKTVLLLALLHDLGVEAEPALANTLAGDAIAGHLPSLAVFNHVLVRAVIGGKTYWLDGTRTGDRALDDIPFPFLHWALPVQASGAALEQVTPPPLERPSFESVLHIAASAGLEAPASVHVEQTVRSDDAVVRNAAMAAMNSADADRAMRDYWRGALPWVDPTTVAFTYDDANRVMKITMAGTGKPDWTPFGAYRDLQLADGSLGYDASFKREPGPHSDAPYAVAYPSYRKWTDVIVLPRRGEGFDIVNAAPVDQTVAGIRYQRTSRMADGVVTMVASDRSLTPEVTATDADALALRQLSEQGVEIQAPAADSAAMAAAPEPAPPQAEPKTAADFADRAETSLLKRDFDRAIVDLDQAIKLDPGLSRAFYNRGVAEMAKGDEAKGLADVDRALALNPKDMTALQGRAKYWLSKHDFAHAKADMDAAAKLATDNPVMLSAEAESYEQAGDFEDAVRTLDVSTALNLTAEELNARCWYRAEWGQELDKALDQCNAALKLSPGASAILDSRALVELRLGWLDAAIADYGAALQSLPAQPSSLYGRSLAEARKGAVLQSKADLAQARAIDSNIDATFKKIGLAPP
jgi:tetratricopeptide (TPR) repeat protein